MTVIDASVYIAILNAGELHHVASRAWFEAAAGAGDEIWAPTLFLSEVSSAISRGLGSPALALETVRRLRDSKIVRLVAVDASLADRAAVIAAEYRIRGCDAIYVALAEMLKAPLITLDHQQQTRASLVISAVSPTSAPQL